MLTSTVAFAPAQPESAFAQVVGIDLELLLSAQHERVVRNDNTVTFKAVILQLPTTCERIHFVRCPVYVHQFPNATLGVSYQGRLLARYDADRKPLPSPTNKERAGSAQQRSASTARAASHSRRELKIHSFSPALPTRARSDGRKTGTSKTVKKPTLNSTTRTSLTAYGADIFNCHRPTGARVAGSLRQVSAGSLHSGITSGFGSDRWVRRKATGYGTGRVPWS